MGKGAEGAVEVEAVLDGQVLEEMMVVEVAGLVVEMMEVDGVEVMVVEMEVEVVMAEVAEIECRNELQ